MKLFYLDITPDNLVFIVSVALHRLYFKLIGKDDPSSAPFISGDTFRSLADHIYDAHVTLVPHDVREKDIVFVGFSRLQEYFESIHPQISYPYVLITHDGDMTIDKEWTKYIDKKIIHWFSQNVNSKHPKLSPIPIGLENLDYYNHGVPSFFQRLEVKKVKKENKILFGFSIHTNPKERQKAFDYISHNSNAQSINKRLNGYSYLELAQKYTFVLSPPGNGIDCIRTWEAMYLMTVPIVKRSILTEYFASLGLPLWLVDSWKELDSYTAEKLLEKYVNIQKTCNRYPLYFSYWKEKILSYVR